MTNKYVQFSGANPFGSQAKLISHYDRLHEYLSTGNTSPLFMEVNPTNECNLSCKWCISENARGKEEIEIGALERYFNDFYEIGGKAITFSGGGEPTIYKHFKRAVMSAKEAGLELGLMTDGIYPKRYTLLIGENFQWIRFSIDTLDEENYQKWKGAKGVKVARRNAEALQEYSVKVGINSNICSEFSVEEAKNLIEWLDKSLGFAYLQFRPILPRYFKHETPQLNESVWEYLESQKDNPRINLSNDKRHDIENNQAFSFESCEGHFFEPILDATGEVKICIYYPGDDRFTFGNIYDKSFKEIWESNQRKKTIEFVRSLDYKNHCQMCCKLTEPNKLIDFLKHPERIIDVNFL